MESGETRKEPAEVSSAGPEKDETKTPDGGKSPPPKTTQATRRRLLRWGIVALALIVALVAWIATRGDDNGTEPETASTGFEAKIVSEAELEEIAASSDHPVYWAGPAGGKELEVNESPNGDVQVSYLDGEAGEGEGQKALVTIGSYPLPDPAAALEGFAKRKGSTTRTAADGREVVTSTGAPSSVYFSAPDGSVQVEVYAVSPAHAMSLALSGEVQPIG